MLRVINHPVMKSILQLISVIPFLLPQSLSAAPIPIRITVQDGQHILIRGDKPYFIKGAGGDGGMAALSASGANSLRLWGEDGLGEKLDQATQAGLTVSAGIWLGQVRQGFDWSDAASLVEQREKVRAVVEKFKDHPALLIWSLGNEMEDTEGRNGAVWSEVDSLAAMVKQIDPNHPVMTVIAEIGGEKVENLHSLCPNIDIVGINSYAGAASVGKRYRELGGTKPYILTEFGTAGIWEIQKDVLGAYPEKTSTAKADDYRRAYEGGVLGHPNLCLGSYTFLWGGKQEVTATWFSMLLPDGSRLAPADTMHELWSGHPPANRCPVISRLDTLGPRTAKPGEMLAATIDSSDPEGDPLSVEWILQQDPAQFGTGGDAEAVPPTFPEAIVRSSLKGAEIKAPENGGLYRLFAYVRDGKGGAAVANVSLQVDAPVIKPKGKPSALPLIVFAEDDTPANYVPSGWMGNTEAIRLDPKCSDNPREGSVCLRCEFSAKDGWGGVVWQSPANDWGDIPGGYDLSGARKLTFWARGAKGGETVSFSFGVLADPKPFPDTAKASLEAITLTAEWQQFEIPVTGKDLTRIKTGFIWTAAGSGSPTVFYLDSVRWE
jgi:hypothetical protein